RNAFLTSAPNLYWLCASVCACSAHIARMTQGIAAGLWPDGQAVGLHPDRDAFDRTILRIDRIDDVVEAARQPEIFAVGADIAHIGAATTRDRPVGDDLAAGEIDHRDAALAMRLAMDMVRAAIGDIELGAVTAGIEAMGADAGLDEADLGEALAIDHM